MEATAWIESLSPWPKEFGLGRMRALLTELGEPQRAYPSIHVVGTKGKSTATRTIDALLRADGLGVGSYTSPHVSGWEERIQIDGEYADFEAALARIRPAAERLGATQFEALTAAALVAFADAAVDVAVLEAGLGGRLDATNVVDAPIVLLTNVGLEHTDVLGDTHEKIANEKLAVAHAANVVVMPDDTYAHLVPRRAGVVVGGAREAAHAFAGRAIDADPEVALPGRYEMRSESPLEIWDGAHTPDAIDFLFDRLDADFGRRGWVAVVSVLADKDVERILWELSIHVKRLVATASSNLRALAADEVARVARDRLAMLDARPFSSIDVEPDPVRAVERARRLAGVDGAVLVTGSLYLLADLYRQAERVR